MARIPGLLFSEPSAVETQSGELLVMSREETGARVDDHIALPTEAKEAGAEEVFRDLAAFTAEALGRKLAGTAI